MASKNSPLTLRDYLAILLVIVGLLQIIGLVSGVDFIWNLGYATSASPLPIILADDEGLGSFATMIRLEGQTASGEHVVIDDIIPFLERIDAPNQRRGPYYHSLMLGHLFERAQVLQVYHYALCAHGPLAQALGLDDLSSATLDFEFSYRPTLSYTSEVTCS